MAKTLAIIGAGRVGQTLGRALRRRGWRVGAVVTRRPSTARAAVRFIGAGKASANLRFDISEADVFLVTTADSHISSMAGRLATLGRDWRGKVVLHTSGALSSRELGPLRRKGAAVGACHPIYPFPRPLRNFPHGVVFDLEGDHRAVKEAAAMVRALRGVAVRLTPRGKVLSHAAGTLAAGHLLALVDLATQGLVRAGVPRRFAWQALQPLVRETLAGYTRWGAAAWTGPLQRGDVGTVRRHLAALKALPRPYREAYLALARALVELYRNPRDPATRKLRRLLKR